MQAVPSILSQHLPAGKFLSASGRMSFTQWLHKAKIMLRGQPYGFSGHEYLKQIVEDDSPNQTFEKAAQVGISTVVLLKSLYVADHLGMKALYYFQDDTAVSDFSNDRCLPVLEQSPYLSERVRNINNVGLKQIGEAGSLYFRGLFSRGKAKSVDGDMLVLDEVSEMNEEHRALAMDRIMHSKLQWVFQLSQPDLPGLGIDAEFMATDQHYWHIVCPSCGHDQCLELEWPKNFKEVPKSKRKSFPDGTTHYRGCLKCDSPLDMSKGVWVAHAPHNKRRGYHLSQLYTQIKSPEFPNYASKIMADWHEDMKTQAKRARFIISVVGFPYGGGAARVHDELLEFCTGFHGFSMQEEGSYMGVDQGDMLTVAICIMSGSQLVFTYFEETEKWDRLERLMERFGVDYCVVDAEPNKHPAKKFATKFEGRVSIQYFGKNQGISKGEEPFESEVMVPKIAVSRTETLDGMIDAMEAGLVILPNPSRCSDTFLGRLETVKNHLKHLTCKFETDKSGRTRRVYAAGPNVPNHYGMAMNSARIAAMEFGGAMKPLVGPVFRRVGHAA